MNGLMMDQLLLGLLDPPAREKPPRPPGNRLPAGRGRPASLHLRRPGQRARQLAKALDRSSVNRAPGWRPWPGTDTATSSPTTRVSGSRCVLHTLNPRLPPRPNRVDPQRRHGRRALPRDTFLPLVAKLAPRLTAVRALRAAGRRRARPPLTAACKPRPRLLRALLAAAADDTTGRCSTSRGLLPSATRAAPPATPRVSCTATARRCCIPTRVALPDSVGLSARDVVLPIVPMFHVNALGMPYAAAHGRREARAPRARPRRRALHALQEGRAGDFSASVPTVWAGQLHHLRTDGLRFTRCARRRSAVQPARPAMLREREETTASGRPRMGHDRDQPVRYLGGVQDHHPRSTPRRGASSCARDDACSGWTWRSSTTRAPNCPGTGSPRAT